MYFPLSISCSNFVKNETNFFPFPMNRDIGCHIDGCAAVLAHSIVVSGEATGKATQVITAANSAAEVALRLIRPGKKVHQLQTTNIILILLYLLFYLLVHVLHYTILFVIICAEQ